MWQWYRNVCSWKSRRPNGMMSYCLEQESRGPSYAFKRLWRAEGVSTLIFRKILVDEQGRFPIRFRYGGAISGEA
ncbi:unnamed protein product [Prunus armeniaca]